MSGDAKYSANGQPLFTDCFSPTETPDFRHRSSSPNSPQTSGTNSSNVDGLDAHIEKTSPPSAIATVKFAKQALRLIDQDEQDRANTKPSTTSSSDNQQPVGLDPPVEKTPPPSATAAVNISEQALLLMDQDGQHPANAKPPTNSASGNQQPVRLDAPVERHVRSDGKIGAVYNIDPEEYSLHLVGDLATEYKNKGLTPRVRHALETMFFDKDIILAVLSDNLHRVLETLVAKLGYKAAPRWRHDEVLLSNLTVQWHEPGAELILDEYYATGVSGRRSDAIILVV